jgi:surfactin synthase thioesterase subunit
MDAAPSPPSSLARRVNLIEVLTEEHGGSCAVSDDAFETMTEQQIRDAFAAAAAVAAAPVVVAAPAPLAPSLPPAEPDARSFALWFPRAAQAAATPPPSSSSSSSSSPRRLLVVAFPPAGCGEDVYTYSGTTSNPMLEWCREHGRADLLAAQPPGRGARLREPPPPTLRAYAAQVAPLIARRVALASGWAVVGHSMGSWAAVEVVRALARLYPPLPPPRLLVVGAMPPPDWPEARRPWRRQRDLDDGEFREECRLWDVSPTLLQDEGMWKVFRGALRADFRLFDEYREEGEAGEEGGNGRAGEEEGKAAAAAANCAAAATPPAVFAQCGGEVLAFWGARDRRVTREMVEAWRLWAAGSGGGGGDGGDSGAVGPSFSAVRVEGHHLWPLEWRQRAGAGKKSVEDEQEQQEQEDPRVAWLRVIAGALQRAADAGGFAQ